MKICSICSFYGKSILSYQYIYVLIIYQYRLEIRQHCNQSASAFVQVRLSRDVCYVTLVRSSSHRAQYEPNRGVKTKHKKNCRYWKENQFGFIQYIYNNSVSYMGTLPEKQSLRMPSKIRLRFEP